MLITAGRWLPRNPAATLSEDTAGQWWIHLPADDTERVIPEDVNAPLGGVGDVLGVDVAEIAAALAAASRTANLAEQAIAVRDICRRWAVPELWDGMPTHSADQTGGAPTPHRLRVADVAATSAALDALGRCFDALPGNLPPKAAFATVLSWAQRIGLPADRADAWDGGPGAHPRDELRLLLSQVMGETLRAFGVTVGVGWESRRVPQPVMYAPDLFGMVAAAMVLRMGEGHGRPVVRCEHCGSVVMGARIRSDTSAVYCDRPGCQRAKERDRKRRQRAKAGAR
jgi:hypothetical protein